ncbi:hypothetical protein K466DRAFT_601529 [Polyporus arcularius HHB13444]|uniref:Uncharacterized protein n=1 Tax=Polyporus arcularius HHB13444 TaxID=1314778 RepID=A0A5C3PGI5_9APHY|nr:hypothetical protein K466DRAFT_601529 [Polyporus arcularius HHB13444]
MNSARYDSSAETPNATGSAVAVDAFPGPYYSNRDISLSYAPRSETEVGGERGITVAGATTLSPVVTVGTPDLTTTRSENDKWETRGLLFVSDLESAMIVIVRYIFTEVDYKQRATPLVAGLTSAGNIGRIQLKIGRNKRLLDNPYELWYSTAAFTERSPTTQSIVSTYGPELGRRWFGTMLVMKFSDGNCESYTDVCEMDVGLLKGYFNGEWDGNV